MERIVALHPDLIAAGYWESSRAVPRLRAMGYKVVEVRNPRSLADLYASIETLAAALGRPESAKPVVAQMKRGFADIERRARSHRRLRAYSEVDVGPWTPGGPDYLTEACKAAGLDNIFSDLKSQAAHISMEAVVERNPEVVISLAATREEVVRRAGWASVEAVRRGWVIDDLDHDAFVRPSPRLVGAIADLETRVERFLAHD
jgi:ABC-type Fe3+-hydroxamate transport system substrate-binding protein